MKDILHYRRYRFDALFRLLTGSDALSFPQTAQMRRDIGLGPETPVIAPSQITQAGLAHRAFR